MPKSLKGGNLSMSQDAENQKSSAATCGRTVVGAVDDALGGDVDALARQGHKGEARYHRLPLVRGVARHCVLGG